MPPPPPATPFHHLLWAPGHNDRTDKNPIDDDMVKKPYSSYDSRSQRPSQVFNSFKAVDLLHTNTIECISFVSHVTFKFDWKRVISLLLHLICKKSTTLRDDIQWSLTLRRLTYCSIIGWSRHQNCGASYSLKMHWRTHFSSWVSRVSAGMAPWFFNSDFLFFRKLELFWLCE